MDTINIAVKFNNRKFGGRVYSVSGATFVEMKDAIKSLGGRFDESKKYWLVSNDARKTLKEQYSIIADDFTVEYFEPSSIDRMNNKTNVHVRIESKFLKSHVLSWNSKDIETARADVARFVAAFQESDEKMIQVGKEIAQ